MSEQSVNPILGRQGEIVQSDASMSAPELALSVMYGHERRSYFTEW